MAHHEFNSPERGEPIESVTTILLADHLKGRTSSNNKQYREYFLVEIFTCAAS
jgi:hypothetical protein